MVPELIDHLARFTPNLVFEFRRKDKSVHARRLAPGQQAFLVAEGIDAIGLRIMRRTHGIRPEFLQEPDVGYDPLLKIRCAGSHVGSVERNSATFWL